MRSWLLFLVLFFFHPVSAQIDMMEKERLGKLVEERKVKFSEYMNSIEKKSGIFGNKTKRDIQLSNEVLIDIVKTDNTIISVLNRAIDFKSFEKTTFNYDKLQQDEKMGRLADENKALSIKIDELNASQQRTQKQLILYKTLFYLLILTAVVYFIFRKRKTIV